MTSEIHCSAVSRCVPHWADRTHLLLNVVERVGRVDGEADEDDVRVGVAERAQAVVVLLAGRVPQRKLDVFAVDLDVRDVVLEHRRDVDLARDQLPATAPLLGLCAHLGERALAEDDQQAGLCAARMLVSIARARRRSTGCARTFPHAPSPTMTSLRRISDICAVVDGWC
jgi:hypothetical protein